jgi:hypothetical protein
MLLSAALFALFLTGCWLYCVTDAKRRWIAQMLASAPDGAADGDDEDNLEGQRWTAADDAVARHPAGRARTGQQAPRGPDDDQDFLRELDRTIRRGNPPVS